MAMGVVKTSYRNDGFNMDIYTLADGKEIIYAKGPNNPASTNVSYLLERTYEKCPTFVNVIEAHKGESIIRSVNIEKDKGAVTVTVTEKSGREERQKIYI